MSIEEEQREAEEMEARGEVLRITSIARRTVGAPRREFAWEAVISRCDCGNGCPPVTFLRVVLAGGVEAHATPDAVSMRIPQDLVGRAAFQPNDLELLHQLTGRVYGSKTAAGMCEGFHRWLVGTPNEQVVRTWLAGRGN